MLRYLLLFSIFLSSWNTSQTPNCGCEQKPEINVLAVVNGVRITRQDLSIETRTNISLAQEEVIIARGQQLNLQIHKMLLDAEAKKRGITPEKLFELEVTAKVTPPKESEARQLYEQNKGQNTPEFKSLKKDLIARLRNERETLRTREFANALRVAAHVTVSDLPVTPPRNEAELARVFATVNGVNITSLDIEQSLLPMIFRVQQQVYAWQKQDVDLRINDMLLEQEAKRLNTTPVALLNQNVRIKMPIITEAQARAFHKANKGQLQGEFSEMKVQIMQYLAAQEERKLVSAYAEELRKGAAVQIYLVEPRSPDLRQLCCNPVD